MNNENPSDTYKLLYYQIIDELFMQICENTDNYCVKYKIGNDEMPIAIWKKYEEYKKDALNKMSGQRLDRHKLASCICGAIIETRPLAGYNGAKIKKNANEIFALYVGLNVIKFYMMQQLTKNIPLNTKNGIIHYLKENFNMKFPTLSENICDTQEYRENLSNAIYWSHHFCHLKQDNCFHYDIWAYSKIFYHLEIYNKNNLNDVYQRCIKKLA